MSLLGKDLVQGKLYHISHEKEDIEFYFMPYNKNLIYSGPEPHFFRKKAVVMFLERQEIDGWIEYKVLMDDRIVYIGYADNQYLVWKKANE